MPKTRTRTASTARYSVSALLPQPPTGQHVRKVLPDAQCVDVVCAQHPLEGGKRGTALRLGLLVRPLLEQQIGQVMQDVESAVALGSECPALGVEH